jgi:hypothetical protein
MGFYQHLREVDGLVLAFIGLSIFLWASATGHGISIWVRGLVGALVIAGLIVFWVRRRKMGNGK